MRSSRLGAFVWTFCSSVCLAGALLLADEDKAPRAAVEELLAADRSFGAAAAKIDLVSGIGAMLADEAVMPLPGGTFAKGAAEVRDAFSKVPGAATSRVQWTPVRGGISADAQHGFTFGYMTEQRQDGTKVPLKYLAYWIRTSEGWRVAVYRRRPRAEGNPTIERMEPSLPPRLVRPDTNPSRLARIRESLIQAEQAFSDEAQRVGLRAAFTRNGRADAVNMGGPTEVDFVVGSEAIGRNVGAGGSTTSSEVAWSAQDAIVASSGDLGVTIGIIRSNKPAADGARPSFAFFTIWRRASPADPWRYIAE
jgi:ketosteroid isomerase-like protein